MSDISQLENKVSVEDIDVELYKMRVTELAAEKPNETEPPEGEFTTHIMSGKSHVVTFKIDNTGTDFKLDADTRTFADWGSFSGNPTNVLAKQVGDTVCSVSDNSGFFTGAAGMVGYSITSNGKTVYLRLAATDPYASLRDNRTMVALYDNDQGIDQSNYNAIYDWGNSAQIDFDGKHLKVEGDIGSANICTAKFTIKWE